MSCGPRNEYRQQLVLLLLLQLLHVLLPLLSVYDRHVVGRRLSVVIDG